MDGSFKNSALTPTIRLWESVGLGLIVDYPSGIVYSNQTGGTACMHPGLEGVFIPLRNDVETPIPKLLSPENDLCQYFEGPKHNGTGATSGLDLGDADYIDGLLTKYSLAQFIAVDRKRLTESHEAWVHAIVHGEESEMPIYTGLGPYPRAGILTWCNSD